jgi:hypothetical protein
MVRGVEEGGRGEKGVGGMEEASGFGVLRLRSSQRRELLRSG